MFADTGEKESLPEEVTYTFRTTFDLTGASPGTAVLQGRFIADNHVDAIRLNGRHVDVPVHDCGGDWRQGYHFQEFHAFKASSGFVAGTNVLEIVVFNGDDDFRPGRRSPMLCRVELKLSAVPVPPPTATARRRQGEERRFAHEWSLTDDMKPGRRRTPVSSLRRPNPLRGPKPSGVWNAPVAEWCVLRTIQLLGWRVKRIEVCFTTFSQVSHKSCKGLEPCYRVRTMSCLLPWPRWLSSSERPASPRRIDVGGLLPHER